MLISGLCEHTDNSAQDLYTCEYNIRIGIDDKYTRSLFLRSFSCWVSVEETQHRALHSIGAISAAMATIWSNEKFSRVCEIDCPCGGHRSSTNHWPSSARISPVVFMAQASIIEGWCFRIESRSSEPCVKAFTRTERTAHGPL